MPDAVGWNDNEDNNPNDVYENFGALKLIINWIINYNLSRWQC